MKFAQYSLLLLAILAGVAACNSKPGIQDVKADTSKAVAKSGLMEEESLRQAALDGKIDEVKQLLEAGTNVNAPNAEGRNALMSAAFNGHSGIVLTLLDSGAALERRDLVGRTALFYASTGPFPETVKILLDKGAEPNIVDSEEHFSPLMFAASEGNLEVVRILMEYKADPALTDVDGDNAETFARQAGHIEVAEFLHSFH
jgi:ankyrin repeat protein